jgi:hypothetical protein
MSRKVATGEGADGLFLKTLTEVIGRLGAIDPAKAAALRIEFHAELMKNPRVAESPKEFMRHEGTILERMFSTKPVEVPAREHEFSWDGHGRNVCKTAGCGAWVRDGKGEGFDKPCPFAGPKPDVVVPMTGEEPALSAEDFGLSDFDLEPEPENPYTKTGGVLATALDEWATTRKHPYVRTVQIDGKKYTVIGTAVVHGPNGETSININATTGAAKKIRECDENVLVHFHGRAVSMQKDVPGSACFFVWLCHYVPGRVFRFWMNKRDTTTGTRKDDPRGSFRVLITDDFAGWRKVAA